MKYLIVLCSLGLFWGLTPNTPKETYNIKGIVVDADTQEGLIAANIVVPGTASGTTTDYDGTFSLTHSTKCVEVEVSYIGFQKEKTTICYGKENKIELKPEEVLEEVVVQAKEIERTENRIASRPMHSGAMMKRNRSKLEDYSIGYVQAAPAADAEYQPPFNTEDYDHINENRFLEATQNPLSTFSIDVDAASYSNMRRFVQYGQEPPADAIRMEEMINYFNYEYEEPKGDDPFNVITEYAECPWAQGHKLLHVGLQGKQIPTENLPASNLVFLIDVSGSMSAANKLPLLRSSFKLLVDQMREQDRIAIAVYAGAAGLVLPSTSGADKQKLKEAFDKLQAGGSTAGAAGIKLAYQTAREHFVEGGNNRVILATDGDFNVGQSSDSELVRLIEKERESGIFLTVLGFGTGNYKDNKMQQLADKGNGNHAYIDNINEAKKVLVNEFGGTLFTIAKDVKIQIEFNPTQVKGYRLLGYENRLLNKEDFNDDKKDAGELGAGHTVTALYEIIPAGVESPFMAQVDELKYQETKVSPTASKSKDLATVKLRYKKPDGQKSKLLEQAIDRKAGKWTKSSNNFRWSAAVAEFAMLLRRSEFKGNANYTQAINLAEGAKGKDPNGYRKEMIDLLKTMKSLVEPELAGK